ncbi:unnamed protein product [Lampetra planeri]
MSTIENSTTTFYELMINNNNHHNQSSLQDAVAFDASPAASHATTRPSGGHARTAEATSAVSRSVPAQRPFGRLPPCAKVETSSSDGLNVLYHVIITLVQLWFSVRRKRPPPPVTTPQSAADDDDALAGAGPPVCSARPHRTRRRRRPLRPRGDAEDVPPWLEYRDPDGFTLT